MSESKQKVVYLSQMYTLHGRHIGPGKVTESDEMGPKTFLPGEYSILIAAEERYETTQIGKSETVYRAPVQEEDEPSSENEQEPPKSETESKPDPILKMSRDELREEGRKRGIPGAEKMSKQQLLALLVHSE